MKRYNYDDYDYDEFDDEDTEEYNEENKDNKKRDKQRKKTKTKRSNKTKKVAKKSRRGKDKTKVIYRNNDTNTHSGFFSFLLFLIIVVLLGVIAYLVYVNYYEEDNKNTNNNDSSINNESEEMCEARTTKYTLKSGLNKCSDSTKFKLNVIGTDLSFDITRTGNEELPYIIDAIYYNDNLVSTSIAGISLSDEWNIKTDGKLIYILITNPDTNILTIIDNGTVIYNDNSSTEYKLGSDVTYTKYTDLGRKEIDTCENYEANNQLEAEMWTKGKLVYENGVITENDEDIITAEDICK